MVPNTAGSRLRSEAFPLPAIKGKVNRFYKVVHCDIRRSIEGNASVDRSHDFRHLGIGRRFCDLADFAKYASALLPTAITIVFSPGTNPISSIPGFLH